MNKKKILFITPSLCYGGLEKSLITLLQLLDENKYEMYLYTFSGDLSLLPSVPKYVHVKNDLLNKHYQRSFYVVYLWLVETVLKRIGAKKKADLFSSKRRAHIHNKKCKQIKKVYKRQRFNTVVANSVGMTTEMAACVSAKKHYVVYHSSLDVHHDLMVNLFSKFEKIVAVNDGVKDMLCSHYDKLYDKTVVIKNYVDANEIIEKANKTVNFNFPVSKNLIVTCGRISDEKGFDLAVAAAEVLKNRGVKYHWFFVGDGSDRYEIEELIRVKSLKDNITITGYKDNPFPYIAAGDIYVQPSYEEAQPLVLLETMVIGKPIVSTRTVGGTLILEDGKKGVLTDFSGESLADGIQLLIEYPDLKYEYSNLYNMEDNFLDRETYINKWDELLSS